tara:strand:- start:105 stop:323 length:219 start_codon:yes stop_codon:yes gene_type:complete
MSHLESDQNSGENEDSPSLVSDLYLYDSSNITNAELMAELDTLDADDQQEVRALIKRLANLKKASKSSEVED